MGGIHEQDDPLNFLSSNSRGVKKKAQLIMNVHQKQEKAQVVKLFSFKPFNVVYAWLTWSKGQGQHLILRSTPTLTLLPAGKCSNCTGAASSPCAASGLLTRGFISSLLLGFQGVVSMEITLMAPQPGRESSK